MIPWQAPRGGDADYVATVRIQNGRIRRLMRERGIASASELARRCKLHATVVGEILNFKKKPLTNDGAWRETVLKIADALGVLPDEMFSAEHLTLEVPSNKRDYMLTHEDVMQLAHDTPQEPEGEDVVQAEQLRQVVAEHVAELKPIEREVLERRYGLAGRDEQTLAEVGAVLGLSPERIRQHEAKALRKLRHVTHSEALATAADLVDTEPPQRAVFRELLPWLPKPPEPAEYDPELDPLNYIGGQVFKKMENALQYQRAMHLQWPAEDLARLARVLHQCEGSST